MILVSYDISEDKLRSKFSKYLSKFGHRVQYSVYEIDNGDRILKNIQVELESLWVPKFKETDSVVIIVAAASSKIIRCGYARHDDEALLIV